MLNIFFVMYLDNILIYTKDPSQVYVEAIQWVFEYLQKHGYFTNLKKCQFH